MKPPSMPVVPDGSLPREVGGLRLLRELGRGGMGIVYEAQEIDTGRNVAVKVLLSDFGVSGEAFERFQREARLAASISHSHCVFVYGAEEIEGSPAIVMELVGGETLEDKIRRGEPVPVQTAVRWTIDVLDGLAAAHAAGVLHRDVKPSNCFVTPEGRVKVGDFGLSRSVGRDVSLTQTGQFLGSPLYASPEQIRGRSFDERSDLYSCAATLYAVLSGRAPYGGSNVGEVLARILSEPPAPLRDLRKDVPEALEHVVLRAMERDPDERYRDLAEFRAALVPFATGKVEVVSPWRRFGAYLIDAFVTVVLSWMLMLAAKLAGWDGFTLTEQDIPAALYAQIALNVLPIVYFGATEGLGGSGLGKWLFGIRVVSNASLRPHLGRAFLRAAVFFGPMLVLAIVSHVTFTAEMQDSALARLAPLALLLAPFVAARRSNGWRGYHDLVSGTTTSPAPPAFQRSGSAACPPEAVASAATSLPESLGDYRVEGLVGATPDGRMLKARDEKLARSVWIHVSDTGAVVADEARRSLARPTRLRWLGVARAAGSPGDVFESPGGTSLPELSRSHGRVPWTTARRLVLELVEDLIATKAADVRLAPEQIWIDRNWGLRVLDAPVGTGPFTLRPAVQLVHEVAHALFLGNRADAPHLPPELPFAAEPAVARLVGVGAPFATLEEIAGALRTTEGATVDLQRRTRGSQMAVNVILPALFVVLGAFVGLFLRNTIEVMNHVQPLADDLITDSIAPPNDAKEVPVIPLDDESRRVREILVTHELSSAWFAGLIERLDADRRAAIEQVREKKLDPSEEEVAWARERLLAEHGKSAAIHRKHTQTGLEHMGSAIALFVTVMWGVFSVPLSFAFAGGFMFWLFGIRIRDKHGRRASRLLCSARTLLAWAPLLLGSIAVFYLANGEHAFLATLVASLVSIGFVLAVFHAIQNPQQSFVDRILGTRLVPK